MIAGARSGRLPRPSRAARRAERSRMRARARDRGLPGDEADRVVLMESVTAPAVPTRSRPSVTWSTTPASIPRRAQEARWPPTRLRCSGPRASCRFTTPAVPRAGTPRPRAAGGRARQSSAAVWARSRDAASPAYRDGCARRPAVANARRPRSGSGARFPDPAGSASACARTESRAIVAGGAAPGASPTATTTGPSAPSVRAWCDRIQHRLTARQAEPSRLSNQATRPPSCSESIHSIQPESSASVSVT